MAQTMPDASFGPIFIAADFPAATNLLLPPRCHCQWDISRWHSDMVAQTTVYTIIWAFLCVFVFLWWQSCVDTS